MENSINNRKKTVLSLIGVLLLILFSVGVTFAFLSYTRVGERANIINTGKISFSFEDNSYIWLSNAMPIPVEKGCSLEANSGGIAMNTDNVDGGVAQFTVSSNSTTRVNYSVYIDEYLLDNGVYTSPSKDLSFSITSDSKMLSPFVMGINLNTDTTGAIFSDTGLGGETYIQARDNDNNSFSATFNENAWQKASIVNAMYSYGISLRHVDLSNGHFYTNEMLTREAYNLPGLVTPDQYLFNPLVYTSGMYLLDDIADQTANINVRDFTMRTPEDERGKSAYSEININANFDAKDNSIINVNHWMGTINAREDYNSTVRYFPNIDYEKLTTNFQGEEMEIFSTTNNNLQKFIVPVSYPKYFSLMDLERDSISSFKLGEGSMNGNQSRYFELRMWIDDEHVNVSDSDVFIDMPNDYTYMNPLQEEAGGFNSFYHTVAGTFCGLNNSLYAPGSYYNASTRAEYEKVIHILDNSFFLSYYGYGEFPNILYEDLANISNLYYNKLISATMNKYKTLEYFNGSLSSQFLVYTDSPYQKNFPIPTFGYTTNEWKNMYFSMKIRVEANA